MGDEDDDMDGFIENDDEDSEEEFIRNQKIEERERNKERYREKEEREKEKLEREKERMEKLMKEGTLTAQKSRGVSQFGQKVLAANKKQIYVAVDQEQSQIEPDQPRYRDYRSPARPKPSPIYPRPDPPRYRDPHPIPDYQFPDHSYNQHLPGPPQGLPPPPPSLPAPPFNHIGMFSEMLPPPPVMSLRPDMWEAPKEIPALTPTKVHKKREVLLLNSDQVPEALQVEESRRVGFKTSASEVVVKRLSRYMKENRIGDKEDFKHLSRKLVHKVMQKESHHIFTDKVRKRINKYVDNYFTKHPGTYKRGAQMTTFEKPSALLDRDRVPAM